MVPIGFSEKSSIDLQQTAEHESLQNMSDTKNADRTFLDFIAYRFDEVDRGERGMMKSRIWQSLKQTLRNKFNYILGIQGFCHFVLVFAMNGLWVINYLMEKYEYSRESASIVSGGFFLATGLGSGIFGKIGSVYPRRIVLLTICTVLMTMATIWFIYFSDDASFEVIVTLSLINGIGCGGTLPIHYSMAREYNACYQCEDTATGFVNFQRTSSGFVAQLVMGWMIDWHWKMRGGNDFDEHDPNLRHYSANDYEFAFSLCTVALVIAIGTLFLLRETNAKSVNFTAL